MASCAGRRGCRGGHTAQHSNELTWFKSSYSGTNGGDCVEVASVFRDQRKPGPQTMSSSGGSTDVRTEDDRVVSSGRPFADPLETRPWGLTDLRVFDPAGQYLRITNATAEA